MFIEWLTEITGNRFDRGPLAERRRVPIRRRGSTIRYQAARCLHDAVAPSVDSTTAPSTLHSPRSRVAA